MAPYAKHPRLEQVPRGSTDIPSDSPHRSGPSLLALIGFRSRPMAALRAVGLWPYPAPLGPVRAAEFDELYCTHNVEMPAACDLCGRPGEPWWTWFPGDLVLLVEDGDTEMVTQ